MFNSYRGIFNHITGRIVKDKKLANKVIGYRTLLHGGYCLVPIFMGTYITKKVTLDLNKRFHLTTNRYIDFFA